MVPPLTRPPLHSGKGNLLMPHKGIIEVSDSRVKVNDNGCWIWQLATNQHGRPVLKLRVGFKHGVTKLAHRAVYEMHGGVIPDGFHLHHTCHDKMCVNPFHMRPIPEDEHRRMKHGSHRSGYRKPKYSLEEKRFAVLLWLTGTSKSDIKRLVGCDSKSVDNWVAKAMS